jgi:hypothetical protein
MAIVLCNNFSRRLDLLHRTMALRDPPIQDTALYAAHKRFKRSPIWRSYFGLYFLQIGALCGRARPSLSSLSPFPPCARLRQPAAHLREGGKGERKIGFVAQDYGLAGSPDSLSKSLLPLNTNIKSIRPQGPPRARAQTPAQKWNPIGRINCKKLDPEVVESARRMRHEAAAPHRANAPPQAA